LMYQALKHDQANDEAKNFIVEIGYWMIERVRVVGLVGWDIFLDGGGWMNGWTLGDRPWQRGHFTKDSESMRTRRTLRERALEEGPWESEHWKKDLESLSTGRRTLRERALEEGPWESDHWKKDLESLSTGRRTLRQVALDEGPWE
jgi:hypothetical protein